MVVVILASKMRGRVAWFAFFYAPCPVDKSDVSDPYCEDYDRVMAIYLTTRSITVSVDAKILYSVATQEYEDQCSMRHSKDRRSVRMYE